MSTSSFELIEREVDIGVATGQTIGSIVDRCASAVHPNLAALNIPLGAILKEFRSQAIVAGYHLNFVIPNEPTYWRDHRALPRTLRTGLAGLLFAHPRSEHTVLWQMSSEDKPGDGNKTT